MPKQTNLATSKSELTNHSCKILNMQILPESDMDEVGGSVGGGMGYGEKRRMEKREKIGVLITINFWQVFRQLLKIVRTAIKRKFR